MSNQEKQQEFLGKLNDLLKEYKADISFTCEGDTYGIYGERIIVDMDGKQIHVNNGFWLEI